MMVWLPGCVVIDGSTHAAATVTVTALLSMVLGVPHWPVTRAKYVVVVAGVTGTVEDVAPGMAVPPGGVPVNHWMERPVPFAVTLRFDVCPAWIDAGFAVATAFDGRVHAAETVTVTEALLIGPPQALVICA